MYILQRVYGFTLQNTPAVLADRLWPRGVSKAKLAGVEWDKAVTPSTDLRKWFHQDPETRYAEFSQRYQAELARPEAQPALQALRDLHQQHGSLILLTAAKDVAHSHLPVLQAVLEQKAT